MVSTRRRTACMFILRCVHVLLLRHNALLDTHSLTFMCAADFAAGKRTRGQFEGKAAAAGGEESGSEEGSEEEEASGSESDEEGEGEEGSEDEEEEEEEAGDVAPPAKRRK